MDYTIIICRGMHLPVPGASTRTRALPMTRSNVTSRTTWIERAIDEMRMGRARRESDSAHLVHVHIQFRITVRAVIHLVFSFVHVAATVESRVAGRRRSSMSVLHLHWEINFFLSFFIINLIKKNYRTVKLSYICLALCVDLLRPAPALYSCNHPQFRTSIGQQIHP